MPHYSDGQEAKVGDLVRGKGYNLRDEAKELREFCGVVTKVKPDAAACNIEVLHGFAECPPGQDATGCVIISGKAMWPKLEYGQCDDFRKVTLVDAAKLADVILCHLDAVPLAAKEERQKLLQELLVSQS